MLGWIQATMQQNTIESYQNTTWCSISESSFTFVTSSKKDVPNSKLNLAKVKTFSIVNWHIQVGLISEDILNLVPSSKNKCAKSLSLNFAFYG